MLVVDHRDGPIEFGQHLEHIGAVGPLDAHYHFGSACELRPSPVALALGETIELQDDVIRQHRDLDPAAQTAQAQCHHRRAQLAAGGEVASHRVERDANLTCAHKSAFCKRGSVNVRFAPKATEVLRCRELTLCAITIWKQMQQVAPLFEDFVGSREQCSRHFEAERFGGLDVEHGFVFRRSLHREVGWFLAFQDAVDVGGGKPIQGGLINPEGDQSAFGEETAEVWDRMEP